jgi:hypothetical protein
MYIIQHGVVATSRAKVIVNGGFFGEDMVKLNTSQPLLTI